MLACPFFSWQGNDLLANGIKLSNLPPWSYLEPEQSSHSIEDLSLVRNLDLLIKQWQLTSIQMTISLFHLTTSKLKMESKQKQQCFKKLNLSSGWRWCSFLSWLPWMLSSCLVRPLMSNLCTVISSVFIMLEVMLLLCGVAFLECLDSCLLHGLLVEGNLQMWYGSFRSSSQRFFI